MPMVKLELGVPAAAATRPCTARPSISQHCPSGETMLGNARDGHYSLSGSLLALGQGEGLDAHGFAWHPGRRASFQMGWGRDCPLGLEPLTRRQGLCQVPGCSRWIGPHMTGEEMPQPPALPLSAADPPFPCDLSLRLGCRSGQGRYRTPPASLHGENQHPPRRGGGTMRSPRCHHAPPLSVCEKGCNPSHKNSTRRKEKGIERRGCCGRRPA